MDDRERRNKLAKRQDAEKQPDPARLGVSLSWDRSRVIGPKSADFRVHYSVTRSRSTVCDAALRDSRQKLLAVPSDSLPSFSASTTTFTLSASSSSSCPDPHSDSVLELLSGLESVISARRMSNASAIFNLSV